MNCNIQSYNYIRAEIFGKKPTKINRIISMRSKPQVHNEFHFSERYANVSCSATTADGTKCFRFKFIGYSHLRERWDTVVVPFMELDEDVSWRRACKMADLPFDWLERKKELVRYNKPTWNAVYYGKKAIPYDLIGQLSHATRFKIWKPNPKKTWCSKAVAHVIGAARPPFFVFLDLYKLTEELRPDQLNMMAWYYFSQGHRP